LGKKGLILPPNITLPSLDTDYIEGHVTYRYHTGGHTDALDWPTYARFAAKFFYDVTPPILGLPLNQTVLATSSAGAIVNLSAIATDTVDDQVPVVLSPASGSLFPIGTTTVTATATDISNNTATDTFTVSVTPVNVVPSGFSLNRRLGGVMQQVALTNVLSTILAGPVYLVLDNLSANTSLVNRNGLTANSAPSGSPYMLVSSFGMAPGETINVTLQFVNPSAGGITYTSRTVSGLPTP
jgi:hypothetical protein